MKYERRTVLMHGARAVKILIPKARNRDLTAVVNGGDFYMTVSNGSGYAYLAELFTACMGLSAGEWIYLQLDFAHKARYSQDFPMAQYFEGLALINYCALQIDAKDALAALRATPARVETIDWQTRRKTDWPDHWKLKSKLTVKERGKTIFLCANGGLFEDMAASCKRLAEYGDDAEVNEFPPHMHYDWEEGTAKSLGITLYYWQNPADAGEDL